jgi:hypothetical protein
MVVPRPLLPAKVSPLTISCFPHGDFILFCFLVFSSLFSFVMWVSPILSWLRCGAVVVVVTGVGL